MRLSRSSPSGPLGVALEDLAPAGCLVEHACQKRCGVRIVDRARLRCCTWIQSAESVSSLDVGWRRWFDGLQRCALVWRGELEAAVGPVSVVVLDIDAEYVFGGRRPVIGSQSRHSRRTVPTNRFAWALAFGAWIGALMIMMRAASLWDTSSNAPVNLSGTAWSTATSAIALRGPRRRRHCSNG